MVNKVKLCLLPLLNMKCFHACDWQFFARVISPYSLSSGADSLEKGDIPCPWNSPTTTVSAEISSTGSICQFHLSPPPFFSVATNTTLEPSHLEANSSAWRHSGLPCTPECPHRSVETSDVFQPVIQNSELYTFSSLSDNNLS